MPRPLQCLGEEAEDRFALFVDAGYLYWTAGTLTHGTGERHRLSLEPAISAALAEHCGAYCGLPHLRTYWYDAAEDLIPTAAQQELALQRGVKLRLGRLTASGQKGVDSLIVRDMIRLASDHAIATAFLLRGDHDLRTGVAEAQDHGIQVVLIGVDLPAGGRPTQSIALLRESDDHLSLGAELLSPYVSLAPAEERTALAPPISVAEGTAFGYGRDFGFTWVANASREDLVAISAGQPEIPNEIDSELLRGLVHREALDIGAVLDFETRKALRGGFWSAIGQVPERRSSAHSCGGDP